MTQRLYLDHNATTPLLPSVKEAMIAAMSLLGNASSVHGEGRKIRQIIEQNREKIAAFFSIKPSRVVFTSGATEANNYILRGFSGPVIIGATEHDSVLQPRSDAKICTITKQGYLDLGHLKELLTESLEPPLVSVMIANNQTGIIQPLVEIMDLVNSHGGIFHSDCVQGIGKLPLDWKSLNFNYLSFSGHKIGAPQGIGALIIDERKSLTPLIMGGGQERSFRSGTENFLGIVGLGAAIDAMKSQDWSEIEALRNSLEETLLNRYPEITIFGRDSQRLPNTMAIRMPGVKNELQVMAFDLKGIAISAESACSSGKVKTSHVLKAMGIPEPDRNENIRVSLGLETTQKDIERFITTWESIYLTKQLQQ